MAVLSRYRNGVERRPTQRKVKWLKAFNETRDNIKSHKVLKDITLYLFNSTINLV